MDIQTDILFLIANAYVIKKHKLLKLQEMKLEPLNEKKHKKEILIVILYFKNNFFYLFFTLY